jgi:hypothetical protein
MLLLGAITSTHFNIALQRSEFTNETGWDWLRWGRLSSFTPLLSLIVVLLAGTVVAVVRRLVLAASVSARRLDANVRQRTGAIGHRYRLDEAPVLASFTLLLSSAAVAAVWWYFTPLLFALFQYPSTAEASDLQLLSPYFVWYHNRYRQILSALVIFLVAVWYPVVQLVRRGQSLHKGLWAGGIGVICVGIAMLHFPYRMLYFSKSFEAVRWNDSYCYLIGERSDDALLFCPDIRVPRLRTVSKGSAVITKLGITESLFRHFDSNVGGSTKPAAVPK